MLNAILRRPRPATLMEKDTEAVTVAIETPSENSLAVVINSMSSIEELSKLWHASTAEIPRLEQAIADTKKRVEMAFGREDIAGMSAAWSERDRLTKQLQSERERANLLRARLEELTAGVVGGLNAEVRRVAESLSGRHHERVGRLREAVKVVAAILEEARIESGRESALAAEKAQAQFDELVKQCGGFPPNGRLNLHEAVIPVRMDPIISILAECLDQAKALQR